MLKLAYRDGGKTSEEGLSRLFSQFIERDGVVGDGDFAVTAASTPDNTVKVAVGDIAVGKNSPFGATYPDYFYHGWATSQESITIGANSSGNARVDAIIAYVDLAVVNSASNDNPGALKLVAVAGTPAASPVAPTEAAIQTAVGSSNPWVQLAHVTAANGFTTITNANIVDVRPRSDTPIRRDRILTFDYIAEGMVISQTSGLTIQITAGTAVIGGRMVYKPLIFKTLTASKDTYIYLPRDAKPTHTDDYTYQEVANNAASPSPPANSVLVGIVVTGAAAVTAGGINQGQETMTLPAAGGLPYATTDSLGNIIYPRDPTRQLLGMRRTSSSFGSSTGIAILILSVPVIVPVGRKVKISAKAVNKSNDSIANTNLYLYEDGVTLIDSDPFTSAGTNYLGGAYVEAVKTPTPGLRTYGLYTNTSAGTGIITGPMAIKAELM